MDEELVEEEKELSPKEAKLLRWFHISGIIESFIVSVFITFYDLHSSDLTPFTTRQRHFIQESFWPLQILIGELFLVYLMLSSISYLKNYPLNRIPRLFYILFMIGEFCLLYENKHFFHPSFLSRTVFWLTGGIYRTLRFGFCMQMERTEFPWKCVTITILSMVILHVAFISSIQKLVGESVEAICGDNAIILVMALLFCFEDVVTFLNVINPDGFSVTSFVVAKVKSKCCRSHE